MNSSPELPGSSDLATFLSEHDLVWDRLPTRWEEAPFVGNGLTGTMVYWDETEHALQWILGRSDVGLLDFPGKARVPTRVQIGTLLQRFPADLTIAQCAMRIDLWNAEVTAHLETNHGRLDFRLLAPTGSATFLAEFEFPHPGLCWTWESGILPEGAETRFADRTLFVAEDFIAHPRMEVPSGGFAVAWAAPQTGPHSSRLVCAIGCTPVNRIIWNPDDNGISAKTEAERDLDRFLTPSMEDIRKPHREWWHSIYRSSFFSFSHRELETVYWTQIYKFASSSRPDRPMIDNHGIWSMLRGYAFSTWDFNVQTTYRTHLTSNLPGFGNPSLHFMDQSFNRETMWDEEAGEFRAGMRQQNFLRYRIVDRQTWEHPKLPCDGPGKFLWGVHNYVMHYRHCGDAAMIPRMVLMLEAGINAMLAGMRIEEDGLWHIPFGDSWECWEGRDPVGLFCVLNWALETAIEFGPTAGVEEKKIERWREIRARTVPYAHNEKGLMLGEGQEPLPHRHWTHLMMLYPFDIVDLSNPDEARLLRKSIDHWAGSSTGLGGKKAEAGFAPPAAICLYAYLFAETPDPDLSIIPQLAEISLTGFTSRGAALWPSTMYREYPGPVMETPFFISLAVQDCMLQSRRSGIHVFPAVPSDWPDAMFDRWHAEGNFLVSARRTNGRADWIAVESLSGGVLRLHTDLDPDALFCNGQKEVNPGERLSSGRLCITREMVAGEKVVFSADANPDLTVRPAPNRPGPANPFGFNEQFLRRRPAYLDNAREFTETYNKWFASLPENRP